MNDDQTSALQAALTRAAATLRQAQGGQSANSYVANNFGQFAPVSNTPAQMRPGVAAAQASMPAAPSAPALNPNGSIQGAVGNTSVGGAPVQPQTPQPMQWPRPQASGGSQHQGIIPTIAGFFGAGNPGTNANGSIQGAVGPTSVGGAPLAKPQDQGGLIQTMLGYLGNKANT